MEKMFCLGFVLGAVGGALVVANNYKARSLVKKSQCDLMEKVNQMMDEKLGAQEQKTESTKTEKSSKK